MAGRITRRLLGLAVCGVMAVGVSACTGSGDDAPEGADLVAGKRDFLIKCGSCHKLDRAGTHGTQGPDLDEAFHQALADGMGRGGVRGIVAYQIEHPNNAVKQDSAAYMPANLVRGDAVENVAAYVAYAVDKTGRDQGELFGKRIPNSRNGEEIFSTMCRACHTLAAARTSGTIGPNLDDNLPGQPFARVQQSIVDPDAEPTRGYQRGIMPPNYEHQLRPDQLQALTEYLVRVAGREASGRSGG